jgi:hypothetical protein
MRLGSYRKGIKSRVEFFFAEGPFPASLATEQDVAESGGGSEGRSWWVELIIQSASTLCILFILITIDASPLCIVHLCCIEP